MDRTQYGLREPTDAYRPFDIACKTKPLPGYALLADLQSSVPRAAHSSSQSPGPRAHPSPSYNHPAPAYSHSPPAPYINRSPGPQPQHNGQFRYSSDSNNLYPNGDVDPNPRKVYYQESKEEVRTETRSSGPNPAPEHKTDELESLLSELNSSRYTGIVDRSSGAMAPPASAGRPSVDYLLNELNSVNSTSRSTTQNHVSSNHVPSNPPPLTASTATKELDDLMAELSDIKEDRSWVSALENQIESEDHPERVGATTSQSSKKTAMSTFQSQSTKTSQSSSSKSTRGSPKSSHGLTFKTSQDSGFRASQGSKSPKPPRTPPPRPPTPRNVSTPPPRPPAPADTFVGAPPVIPCPDTPPPIPPPPAIINASPTTTLNRKTPVVAEPFERPDSGGPVKRNDAAYRWITDEIKYEIRAVQDEPEEEPPIIPEPQNDKLRSPALVRKLLNRTDTYAKPQKPRSPSPAPPPPPPAVKDPSPPPVNELDCMLGSLTTHMTEQGVNTTNKGSCCACDKPIVGQVITALGKTWHPEHFKCGHCKQELGAKNFFERDGKPYCEACYHELFSPRCAYCNGSILDKCVTALDKNWHPDHFFCAQCGNTFGEEGFHEKDGKAYCREDYYNMFAPKCGGCNSPIMENYISALNAQWHPECFVCRDCKKPVTGKSYYAMENQPVCAACVGVSDDEEDGEEED